MRKASKVLGDGPLWLETAKSVYCFPAIVFDASNFKSARLLLMFLLTDRLQRFVRLRPDKTTFRRFFADRIEKSNPIRQR